ASFLALQKNYEGAESMLKRAIAATETSLGSEHADLLKPLTSLANLHMTAGRLKDAEPCYKRILEIKHKVFGEDSTEIVTSLLQLGELYMIQSNFAEAEVTFETAFETAQRVYEDDDSRLADVMLKYATALSHVGKDKEGAELHARAEKIKDTDLTGIDDDIDEALGSIS
ncbi:MAG TPA: tetratricopeptide repeat protein, partial [Chroococcales cyanobacterium]